MNLQEQSTSTNISVDGALTLGGAQGSFSAPSRKPASCMTVRRMSAIFVVASYVAEQISGSEDWSDSQVRTCIKYVTERVNSEFLADVVLMVERDDTAVEFSNLQDVLDLVPRVSAAVGAA